jgi:hypothetical protein
MRLCIVHVQLSNVVSVEAVNLALVHGMQRLFPVRVKLNDPHPCLA